MTRRTAVRRSTAAVAAAAALAAAACGGTDIPTRQEFVDRLDAQSDGLVTEDVGSCIYDRLLTDDDAAAALRDAEEDGPLPPELEELVVACIAEDG